MSKPAVARFEASLARKMAAQSSPIAQIAKLSTFWLKVALLCCGDEDGTGGGDRRLGLITDSPTRGRVVETRYCHAEVG